MKDDPFLSKAKQEEMVDALSGIPCGLCIYKVESGRIKPLYHNEAFFKIMGYSREQIENADEAAYYLGVHPEDEDLLREKVKAAVCSSGVLQHIYRAWNDELGEYRYIQLEASVSLADDGAQKLYGVYSDMSEQMRLKKELTSTSEKMQDIVNAIPGGVAIYRVSDIFETVYFSDGVAELTGYSPREYNELISRDAAEIVNPEDAEMVVSKVREAIENNTLADLEFRKQHRDGHVVWVHVQAKQIGEENGFPLIQCVFHNISELKEAKLELDHLINSIPGGIASYRVEDGRLVPVYFSDGVPALFGNTREEFLELAGENAMNAIYELDRDRVAKAVQSALSSGEVLDIYYRARHKDKRLVWIHLNGRRTGPTADNSGFYAVYTGMSQESRMYQNMAVESVDGIYIIDKENYELLYASENKKLFIKNQDVLGSKCYAALYGRPEPCEFCTLKTHKPDSQSHEMIIPGSDKYYMTRFRETDWNGIPAYIKYVSDVTEDVRIRREKERLEQYFQTMMKYLPGGVAVVCFDDKGNLTPEFLSDGFAEMTGMSYNEAWELYKDNALKGVHPDDREELMKQMNDYIAHGKSPRELVYRLIKGDGSYIWVKNTLSIIQSEAGENRIYAVYNDMTNEREEKEQIRKQFNDLIVSHYRAPGPNAIIVGHCNITQNRILKIDDYTNSNLMQLFGMVREEFFTRLSGLVCDEEERRKFQSIFLGTPALEAFKRNEINQVMECFIKLPQEKLGRYARFEMNMVSMPDSGDVTGILTVSDVTSRTVTDKIQHELTVASCDLVADVDLTRDSYVVLAGNLHLWDMPEMRVGSYSQRMKHIIGNQVVPRDKKRIEQMLGRQYIIDRLEKEKRYSFSYSLADESGKILTKNLTVLAVDLRIGRICLARTDITSSVREQQALLNVIAYTFELAGFVDIGSGSLTLYTRETVLKNLLPSVVEDFDRAVKRFTERFNPQSEKPVAAMEEQFNIEGITKRLSEKQAGYDVVFPYYEGGKKLYKQVNVLWGDQNHRTVCFVRADVTDMLENEKATQKKLESALSLAEEASRAKSEFLSAMSHDIRTPMNAIMGMTKLAAAHLDDRAKVEDCLNKVSVSSKHLLSLVNDILDMSKIECSKVTLNKSETSVTELIDGLSSIIAPQADAAEISFNIHADDIDHEWFNGDQLRINQIMINILSNAVKFTPGGGKIDFTIQEIHAKSKEYVKYRFTVKDTGTGMSKEFLEHIFDPFTRSKSAGSVEGTGLGLSITKGLVDLMGGQISVSSEPGTGSVFTIELECEVADEKKSAENSAHRSQIESAKNKKIFKGRRFLVAEDNALNAEILCELLKMFGAESLVATDGKQAVSEFEKARPGAFDAVLMDIRMPVMDGYEATMAIRAAKFERAKTIPIIAMTANAFAEDIQKALDSGMNAHVAKPIDVDILCKVLLNALPEG